MSRQLGRVDPIEPDVPMGPQRSVSPLTTFDPEQWIVSACAVPMNGRATAKIAAAAISSAHMIQLRSHQRGPRGGRGGFG
jgi:hypothetical protein